MEIKENIPIVVFDDLCYLCTKFAKVVNYFAGGKITIIGHYSKNGEEIRNQILDDNALEMFWLIDEKSCLWRSSSIVSSNPSNYFIKKEKSKPYEI